jgi:hypothetical protein
VKWQSLEKDRVKSRARRIKEMYGEVAPTMNKETLHRLGRSMFKERLHNFHLQCMRNKEFYNKLLKKKLMQLCGVVPSNRKKMKLYKIDYEIICEMLKMDFDEARSQETFKAINTGNEGYVTFSQIFSFFEERLRYHQHHAPPTVVLDPVDEQIKLLTHACENPVFDTVIPKKDHMKICKMFQTSRPKLRRVGTGQVLYRMSKLNSELAKKDLRKKEKHEKQMKFRRMSLRRVKTSTFTHLAVEEKRKNARNMPPKATSPKATSPKAAKKYNAEIPEITEIAEIAEIPE